MNMRTIGIGIVAVALILAISMTASADPEPEGATPGYLGSWATTGAATGTFTDGHALDADAPMEIQLLVTTAVSGGDLLINVSYVDNNAGTAENTTMITISSGTTAGTYQTVTLNDEDSGVEDIVNVYVYSTSAATDGDFVIVATEKATADAAGSTEVRGGYISSMDLSATPQTCNWAGYFGEVTGTLTLDDATGDRMYSWAAADIGGEVYASTASSITWSGIVAEAVADVDGALGYMDATMSDSVTNTFTNTSNSAAIDVGTVQIGVGATAATYMFVDGAAQTTNFEEVILHDGTDIVWTAIISPNADGYETTGSETHDYQMIVPEDGSGNTVATTYYFYVELT